jgi:hypothetical protein
MPLSALQVSRAGDFPLIDVTDTSGTPKITLMESVDSSQRAVFDLTATSYDWNLRNSAGFVTRAVLESNTVQGADFSPFLDGGILRFSTTGVTIDPGTNTATVSEGATGSFTLTPVPESSTAILAIIGGSMGLLWLWRTRSSQVAA